MKTASDHIAIFAKKLDLLPIGTQVVMAYPKDDDFMKTGIIVDYFQKNGAFYWDYKIQLTDGGFVYSEKNLVEPV